MRNFFIKSFEAIASIIVVIGVVALIAIGPKELPGVLRTVGQYMGKVRRMASEFQSQFQEAMREAEMADIKKSVDEITDAATKQFTNFDPIGSVRKEIESLSADPFKDGAPTDTAPTATASASLACDEWRATIQNYRASAAADRATTAAVPPGASTGGAT